MEQPSVELAVSIRPAPPRREFRRRHAGRGRTAPPRPQNGTLRVQPLLPGAVRQPPRQTPHRHPEGRPLQRHAQPPRLHVQGRGQRRPGQAHGLPPGGGESPDKGTSTLYY